jgi:hypothetical protein
MSLVLSWGIQASHETPRSIHPVSVETPCTATFLGLFCTTKGKSLKGSVPFEQLSLAASNRGSNNRVAADGRKPLVVNLRFIAAAERNRYTAKVVGGICLILYLCISLRYVR